MSDRPSARTRTGVTLTNVVGNNGRVVRVLHVLEAIEGGTARHVVDLVRHAKGVDHEVVIPRERRGGATDRHAAGAMLAEGARVHHLELRRAPVRLANVAGTLRLLRLIRERQPDVVHTHSSIGGVVGRVAGAACRVPCVHTPHGVTDVRAGLVVERMLGRFTSRLIAVSPSERDHVLHLRLVAPSRLSMVPNGIEIDPPPVDSVCDLRSRLGLPSTTPLVGSISRLVPQKAPADLVAAWAVVAAARPDTHFLLVGTGPLQDIFDRAIIEHRLVGRVHQIPSLPTAWAVLDQLDAFTLASVFEGAPYTLLEAVRAGCPIVATDVVGTRDVVEHGINGLLAPRGDTQTLGDLIIRTLDDSGPARHRAPRRAKRLRQEFDVASMAAATVAIYRALIDRPGASDDEPEHDVADGAGHLVR